MEKTMTLNLRVNPLVKQQAEDVLKQLGVPMATAVDVFLRQISLTGGIPFSVSLPSVPAAGGADAMTAEQLRAILQAGHADTDTGRAEDAAAAFAGLIHEGRAVRDTVFGKTVELFWVNGTADGIVTAELSNWNGKGIKVPRTEIMSCQREDVCEPGVYFLLCQEDDGTDSVYIGEAENIRDRLVRHIRDYQSGKEKYYWNTAVIFVGRDLNKALIRYLENRLAEIATACSRYKLLTKNTYKNTVIKESQAASMEEFISDIKVLINAMGYKVLEPVPTATDTTEYLFCKSGNANGKGFISPGGFTVVQGSKVSDHLANSFEGGARTYFDLREKLERDGVIADNVFCRNYEFSAPSAASSVVLGRSSNGRTEWKTQSGKKLSEL